MEEYPDLSRIERDWKPPVELSSTMREVRLSAQGIALAVVATLMFVGAVGAAYGLSRLVARESAEAIQLNDTGIETQAIVTRHWRSGGKSDTPKIAYRFEHDGRIYHGSADTPSRIWRELSVGSPIAVRFVPQNPALNHPAAWQRSVAPRWLSAAAAGALVFSGSLIVLSIRRQMRLLAEGRPAPGRVIGYRRVKHGQMIKYEFRALSGAVFKGQGGESRRPPAIGSTVCVIYDRDNPKRNAPYPLGLVRVDR